MIKLERGRRVGKDVEVERYPSSPLGAPPKGFPPSSLAARKEPCRGKCIRQACASAVQVVQALVGGSACVFGLNRTNHVLVQGAIARKELSEDAWWFRCVR